MCFSPLPTCFTRRRLHVMSSLAVFFFLFSLTKIHLPANMLACVSVYVVARGDDCMIRRQIAGIEVGGISSDCEWNALESKSASVAAKEKKRGCFGEGGIERKSNGDAAVVSGTGKLAQSGVKLTVVEVQMMRSVSLYLTRRAISNGYRKQLLNTAPKCGRWWKMIAHRSASQTVVQRQV